jgi:hypothetical protein
MSTSRWNLLPLRMFRGLPAAALTLLLLLEPGVLEPPQVGLPVMGLTGATHMSAAWALNARLDDKRKARRNGRRRRCKGLGGYEGGFGCSRLFY